jgi:DNA-directed RNA polymerase specialized sigma54-like protein
MGLELRQQLKLSQQLVMTPQLQQAIKLLQMSRVELLETVNQEMLENPLLEEGMEPCEAEGPDEREKVNILSRRVRKCPMRRSSAMPTGKTISGSSRAWADRVNPGRPKFLKRCPL